MRRISCAADMVRARRNDVVRRAIVVLATLALASCALLSDASPSAGVSTNELKTRGAGIIILGLNVLDTKSRSDSILAATLVGISAAFYPVDLERSVARAILPLPVARRNTMQCLVGQYDPDCDLAQMRYVFLEVPAGEYGLFAFAAVWGRSVYETRFSKEMPHISKPDVPIDPAKLVRWRVGPGELVYIGDFTFDAHAFPTRIARLERSDAVASRALAQYPKLNREVQYRLPMIGRAAVAEPGAAQKALEANVAKE